MTLELSHTSMPLDFSSGSSSSINGREQSGSPINVSDSSPSSPPGNSSAFTVVTPKGRNESKYGEMFLFILRKICKIAKSCYVIDKIVR